VARHRLRLCRCCVETSIAQIQSDSQRGSLTLYYLSGLALPDTAAYTVSSHLRREGSLLELTNFKGTLGNSDIHGTLSIETAAERPLLTADLATRLLDIKDLGPTLGAHAHQGCGAQRSTKARSMT
jgi:uncharacterized protein involved in outer membrane biogenesis